MTLKRNQSWISASLFALAVVLSSCSKAPSSANPEPIAEIQPPPTSEAARAVPRRTTPLAISNSLPSAMPIVATPPPKTNTPPTISCGPVQSFPCSSNDGIQATIAVHVEDADGDALSVVWSADGKERYTQQVPATGAALSTYLTFSYTFSAGDHGVSVSVTDGMASAHCETSVTVQKDSQDPVMTCPRDISVPADPGRCSAIVTFTATVTDNCPDVQAACDPPPGSAFPLGVTTVACTAKDRAGNLASCSFQVTVRLTNRCPLNEAFWRQNPGAWPVNSLTLGNQTYTKSQLLSLLHATSAADASATLARQLIAACLNTALGADPRPICGPLTQAHDLLNNFSGKLPYRISLNTAEAGPMQAIAARLNAYNNGMLTPNCAP